MRKDLITSLLAIVVMTVFLGLVYPLAITGISQVVFPGKANGSQGAASTARSSARSLIGQEPFKKAKNPPAAYFQPRPSATGYSGNVTFFGNVGPNSVEAREEVRENLAAYVAPGEALRPER